MNKTIQLLSSLQKVNSSFSNLILSPKEDLDEFKRNINHLIDDNKLIEKVLNYTKKDTNKLAIKMIIRLNLHWVDITQQIDNIRELIDNKLERAPKTIPAKKMVHFLLLLYNLQSELLMRKNKKKFTKSIKHIINDNVAIRSILDLSIKNTDLLCVKTINGLDDCWINLCQNLNNIQKIINNTLST